MIKMIHQRQAKSPGTNLKDETRECFENFRERDSVLNNYGIICNRETRCKLREDPCTFSKKFVLIVALEDKLKFRSLQ